MEENHGKWPDGWTSKFPSLLGLQYVKLNVQANDDLKWRKSDGSVCDFSVSHAYRDLIADEDDVEWWKVVWFSQNIPKHAFIVWLAVQDKLTTQDKIIQWGSYDGLCCALCKNDTDSHSHLFFECGYSREVDEVLALGWILKEIHVTWAHLEKKRTRLRTYTKSLEDLYIQWGWRR
ncbi:reverse transcriptase zinc-binding domain-containing protein, partial [Tanacetum coccineum]